MKQWIAGIMALLLLVLAAGCAQNNQPNDEAPADITPPPGIIQPEETLQPEETGEPALEQPLLTVDSAGREVLLPQPLTRIYPANQEAQSVLFSLAPEKMAGWYNKPKQDAAEYIDAAYMALPAWEEHDAELDWAAVRAAGAQMVLLMGSAQDPATLSALQQKAGLPVLFIDSGLDTLPDAYRTLGGLFGMEEQAEEFVEYIAPAIETLNQFAGTIEEKTRKSVYVAGGDDGLTPLDLDIVPLAGCRNAVPGEQIGKPLTQEAFEKLSIDALVTEERKTYDTWRKSPIWEKMDFVEMGMFFAAPDALFSWLTDTTTAGRLLGAKWLGNLLYPEVFVYDMVEETKLHYDLFWNCQLTDAQANALLENSTLRPRG